MKCHYCLSHLRRVVVDNVNSDEFNATMSYSDYILTVINFYFFHSFHSFCFTGFLHNAPDIECSTIKVSLFNFYNPLKFEGATDDTY